MSNSAKKTVNFDDDDDSIYGTTGPLCLDKKIKSKDSEIIIKNEKIQELDDEIK